MKSVEKTPLPTLVAEATLLSSMGTLSPIAGKVLSMSTQKGPLGTVSQVLAQPWVDLFSIVGSPEEVVKKAKAQGLDTKKVMFDWATEDIQDPKEGPLTAKNYQDFLRIDGVQQIAVKLTGLCPAKYLEPGDLNNPHVKAAITMLEDTIKLAFEQGKMVVIDAEWAAIEDPIAKIAISLAAKYPNNVMLTAQATRRDSLERIQQWIEELPEGSTLNLKLVKGAYMGDIALHPDKMCQSFEETHENYIKILKFAINHPKIKLLPCTHNPELIQLAFELGATAVGNLKGMHISQGIAPEKDHFLYVVCQKSKAALAAYMERRFVEHQKAMEIRRANLLLTAIIHRITTAALALLQG